MRRVFKMLDLESDTIIVGLKACKAEFEAARKINSRPSRFLNVTGISNRAIERNRKIVDDGGMDATLGQLLHVSESDF